MVKISIVNGKLLLTDDSMSIFNWQGKAFFIISLGFELSISEDEYIFSDEHRFPFLIKETIDFLNEEGLTYNKDENVHSITQELLTQDIEFNEASNSIVTAPSKLQTSRTFQRQLKLFQIGGVEHLLKIKHGANFSVPGSGKTTMVYAYFDSLLSLNIVSKIFVIGPFSSFAPWEEEYEQCFGEKVVSARLSGQKRNIYYLQSDKFTLFLCHYQTAANDKEHIIDLCKQHNILLVIDESHYIKRFSGGVWSDALLSIAPFAKRRVILTGTPMPNGLIDLWSQMTFLWPGKQLMGERNAYKTLAENNVNFDLLKAKIRPFFYRVKKSDLKLPEPLFIRNEYDLKPIQLQIYNALSIRLLTDLQLQPNDRNKLKLWRKAKMVRLLQAATNPTLLNRYSEEFAMPPLSADGTSLIELIDKYPKYEIPSKFEAAVNLARNLMEEGKKVLIWTTFIHNIEMLKIMLKDYKFYTIHGAIPKDETENEVFNREKQIREFKESISPCVLIANPAACAESISLHKDCHDAIYVDRTFNCGQYIQSLDRIHRIGLDDNEIVRYHILIAKNTIDETINSRLEEKFSAMLHILEDEIPIGDLDIGAYELEDENEDVADFEQTIGDLRRFLKK